MEDYPVSQSDFERRFQSEDSCVDYLIKVRWPAGYRCPNCQCDKFWKFATILRCASCRSDLRVLAGTLFQDTHTPLTDWFRAIWFIVTQKFGTNAMGLQRVLGMSYSTTWNLLQKLRRAMVRSGRESLIGTVEVDEAYIGGLSEGSPGRAKGDKSLVVLARELNGTAIGRIRMRQIPSSSGENLLGFIKDSVQNGTTVITDGWRGYSRLKSYGYPHIVKPSKADKTAMPHVHRVISLLKRWLLGTLQGAASQKYLDYYLDEYVFRFNRRKSKNRGKLFMRLIEQALVTPPITRVEIRQKKEVHEISSNVIEEVNLDSPIYYQ